MCVCVCGGGGGGVVVHTCLNYKNKIIHILSKIFYFYLKARGLVSTALGVS